jgi:hypothetical protein
MPYIKETDANKKPVDRPGAAPGFAHLTLRELGAACRSKGDLNYVLSQICADYATMGRGPGGGPCKYDQLADVEAALHGALGEFMRRVLWPYEDTKIAQAADPKTPAIQRPIDPLASVAAYARGETTWPEFINMPEDSDA